MIPRGRDPRDVFFQDQLLGRRPKSVLSRALLSPLHGIPCAYARRRRAAARVPLPSEGSNGAASPGVGRRVPYQASCRSRGEFPPGPHRSLSHLRFTDVIIAHFNDIEPPPPTFPTSYVW